MKLVRLVRHGQSAANTGQTSRDHASIPLTPLGLEQARMIAKMFPVAPDLIVASPYARAQATAHLDRSGASPCRIWCNLQTSF